MKLVRSNDAPKSQRALLVDHIVTEQGLTDHQRSVMHLLLSSGTAWLLFDDGIAVGGVGWTHGSCPATGARCLVEMMLYLREDHRGGELAAYLVGLLEEEAREVDASVIYAGSTLTSHSSAKRVYEEAGFTTNYSFKKEI